METKLNYRRDPVEGIENDFDFKTQLKPFLVSASDGDIDLSPFATESNQSNIGCCAGNSTADSVEIVNAIDEADRAAAEGRSPRPPVQLSRLFVYSMARSLMDDDGDGQGDIDKDDGTFIRLCFDVLSRFGICDETVWPYDTSKVFVSPSIKAMRQATGHKIHSYYRIKETGEDRLAEINSAIQARHPVVFGTLVDQAFTESSGPSTVDRPKGATVGGHAMIIVGYVNGLYIIKNSWSKKWRQGGYCFFTPEYLTWEKTWDIWVPTSGAVFMNS
jgi:hypothetical protein